MMDWVAIIVTNVVQPSKTAFAVRDDNGDQVFVPPAVSKTADLAVSDIVQAKLVPNRNSSDGRSDVPWFAALVTRDTDDLMTPDQVASILSTHEYPMTAEELDIPIVALQQAYQAEMATKVIVMPSPRAERIIMWAADPDRV